MEISSSPPLTDLERDNLVSWRSQEVEELLYPEVHGVQQPIRDGQEEEEAAKGEDGKTDGDQCDYLVFEIGEQKGGEEGSESEGGQDTERGREEGQDGGRGETGGENEGKGEIEEEEKGRGKGEGEDGSKGETESKHWGRRDIEGEDEGGENRVDEEEGSGETEQQDGGRGDTKKDDEWIGEAVGEIKDDGLSELLFISDGLVCPSSSEPLIVTSDLSEQPAVVMFQDAWGHDLCNRDDLSDGHLSDCLQAELAIVYSDSDAGEDQWAAFAPCDVTNQEEAGGGIHDSICDGESKKEERGGGDEERGEEEAEVKSGTEEQREKEVKEEQEERRGGRDDDEELMRSRRDLFLRSTSVSSTASSTDPDRRVRP